MVVQEKKVVRSFIVEMSEEELRNICRLIRNEVEGLQCCDSITADMYHYLKNLNKEGQL